MPQDRSIIRGGLRISYQININQKHVEKPNSHTCTLLLPINYHTRSVKHVFRSSAIRADGREEKPRCYISLISFELNILCDMVFGIYDTKLQIGETLTKVLYSTSSKGLSIPFEGHARNIAYHKPFGQFQLWITRINSLSRPMIVGVTCARILGSSLY